MVEKQLYLLISKVCIFIIGGISFTAFIFLSISIVEYFIHLLVESLYKPEKMRSLGLFYSYILDQIELEELKQLITHKKAAKEALAIAISLIKGRKWYDLKKASFELSITGDLEKDTNKIRVSKRIKACYMLGLLGTGKSVRFLMRRLYDRKDGVISAAIIAIGEIGNIDYIKMLLQRFQTCTQPHAWLIAAVISRYPYPEIYREIEKLIKNDMLPPLKVILLIKVITSFHFEESLGLLIELYNNSSNIEIKITSLTTLGKINDLSSVKLVLDALRNDEWEIRAVACNLVGEMVLKGASYRLLPLLRDQNWHVRKNAALALINLGKIGIHALIAYLDTDDRYARDMIAYTLEEKGVIDEAIMIITEQKQGDVEEIRKLLKTLISKGYKKYFTNYRKYPQIDELLKGASAV